MRFALYTNSPDALPAPEWIRTERYMYCDNFINDYMKSRRFGLLSLVRRLLHKLYTDLCSKKDILLTVVP